MLITPANVIWTSYKLREGPTFFGKKHYELPKDATIRDKFLKIVATAEGSHFDAVNMYDRAVVSLGILQWSEVGAFNASRLLGTVCTKLGTRPVMSALRPALELCDASFSQTARGPWRFFVSGTEVATAEQYQQLFLGCSGLRGAWGEPTSDQRARARLWASCFANIWHDNAACAIQVQLASSELINYAFSDARKIMFGDVAEVMSRGWAGATRALYLMYAVNLPSVARNSLLSAINKTIAEKWSRDWCVDVIRELVFAPKIAIYPQRYSAVKNVTEQLFCVELPSLEELKDERVETTLNTIDSPI